MLIYVVADERDVIRLRTNYRKGEEVYLFRTVTTPEQEHGLFLQYLDRLNQLHHRPECYNALTNNCTTNIAVSAAASRNRRPQWDWRVLLNGEADEMMYERGQLVTGGLSLPELKSRHISTALPDPPTTTRTSRNAFARGGPDSLRDDNDPSCRVIGCLMLRGGLDYQPENLFIIRVVGMCGSRRLKKRRYLKSGVPH